MVPTRRALLGSLPALAAGVAGCSTSLLAPGEEGLSIPTRWRFRLRDPTRPVQPPDGPLLVSSRSPFRDDPLLTALDPDAGEARWTVPGEEGRASPAAADDSHGYVLSENGTARAVDHGTGETVWEASVGAMEEPHPGVVAFGPLPAGDRVVFPVSGRGDDVPDRVVARSTADGSPVFEHRLPASLAGAPAVDGDGVVVPLLDGTLRRVTAGGETWRTSLDAPPAAVTVADGTAYAGCATEELLAVDAATGEGRWRGALRNTAFTAPLVADGRVYVGAADYHLYAFDAATGEERWAVETGNAVTAGPTVAGDRLVTLSGGEHDPRGPAGRVPRDPVEVAVHDTDGGRVDSYRFDAVVDGGEPRWAGAAGGGAYLVQKQTVTRLDGVVLGDG